MKIAVLGAGGPTGVECVHALVKAGHVAIAVVRDPAKYASPSPWPEGTEVREGDVSVDLTNFDAEVAMEAAATRLEETALAGGVDGVVFAVAAPKTAGRTAVDHWGAGAAALAAKKINARYVLITVMLVDPKDYWHPIRIILNTMQWGIMDAKFAGENAVRAVSAGALGAIDGQLDYVIIRPGGLVGGGESDLSLSRAFAVAVLGKTNIAPPGTQHVLAAGQRDPDGLLAGARSIHRADVASVVVRALEDPEAVGKTVEIVARFAP